MKFKKLTIVIPAYNEEKSISQLLGKVLAADLGSVDKEIIVINDASSDRTAVILSEYENNCSKVRVYTNETNIKKSQSVKRGIALATGDLVVVQDADLEYEPQQLLEFVKLFNNTDRLDVIYGNRFGKKNKVIYWQNYYGNKFLTLISNLFTWRYGFWVNDMEVCYKMMRTEIAKEIFTDLLSTDNFGLEPEVTAKLARYGAKTRGGIVYKNLPISYYPRSIAEGKHMRAIRDGLRALVTIIYHNLR